MMIGANFEIASSFRTDRASWSLVCGNDAGRDVQQTRVLRHPNERNVWKFMRPPKTNLQCSVVCVLVAEAVSGKDRLYTSFFVIPYRYAILDLALIISVLSILSWICYPLRSFKQTPIGFISPRSFHEFSLLPSERYIPSACDAVANSVTSEG
jgi:hypothetical protein